MFPLSFISNLWVQSTKAACYAWPPTSSVWSQMWVNSGEPVRDRSPTPGSSGLFRSQNTLGGNPSGLEAFRKPLPRFNYSFNASFARTLAGWNANSWAVFLRSCCFPEESAKYPKHSRPMQADDGEDSQEKERQTRAHAWPTTPPLLRGSLLLVTAPSEKQEPRGSRQRNAATSCEWLSVTCECSVVDVERWMYNAIASNNDKN